MNSSSLIAIDIAKQVFHLVMFNAFGKPVSRKKLKRSQLRHFISRLPASQIVMEACGTSHYWGREFTALGHEVALLPPQHVKAYLRGQKNDYNDALAIGEAYSHGKIRSVPIKSIEQQDDQALHRIRKLWVRMEGDIARQLRSLLSEYGIVIPKGIAQVKTHIPLILEDSDNGLSWRCRTWIRQQYEGLLEIEKQCEWYDQELREQAKADEDCQRLQDVPGFGVVNSSALKSWMGNGSQFKQGREASSALGIVPRQHSSGDKQRLLGITKRGDKQLRSLIIHGARAVVARAKSKTDSLSQWINALVQRRGFNKAVVAYANKMVRIAWVILTRKECYRPIESQCQSTPCLP